MTVRTWRHRSWAAMSLMLVAGLALCLQACATGRPATQDLSGRFLITSESLDAAGRQFFEIGTLYNAMLDAKQVTPEQYRAWAAFATRFQQTYPVAVAVWKTARATQDAVGLQAVEARLVPMLHELSALAQALYPRAGP